MMRLKEEKRVRFPQIYVWVVSESTLSGSLCFVFGPDQQTDGAVGGPGPVPRTRTVLVQVFVSTLEHRQKHSHVDFTDAQAA